jgi:hypothetical protein
MNMASDEYPCISSFDHVIKDGCGEPGKTLMDGTISIVRSITFKY